MRAQVTTKPDGTVPIYVLCHRYQHHAELEQAPFEPVIASCYMAILSIQHNLSQKFDLEVVAIASNKLTVFVKLNRSTDGSELHDMHA